MIAVGAESRTDGSKAVAVFREDGMLVIQF